MHQLVAVMFLILVHSGSQACHSKKSATHFAPATRSVSPSQATYCKLAYVGHSCPLPAVVEHNAGCRVTGGWMSLATYLHTTATSRVQLKTS